MNKVITYLLFILFLLSACKEEGLMIDEQLFLRSDGSDMAVWVKGTTSDKVFMIIIHGGPGGNALDYRFDSFTGPLEDRYSVVYWDQRGSGISQGNYDKADLTIEQFATDLHKLIVLLKERYGNDIKIFLYGHSWGGTLGTAFLINEDYQQDITGWIESDGAHNLPLLNKLERNMLIEIGNEQLALENNTRQWTKIVEYCEGIDSLNISLEESVAMNGYAHQAEQLLDEVEYGTSAGIGALLESTFFSHNAPLSSGISNLYTNLGLAEEVELVAYSDDLYKITIPTLLLWGKYDFVTPPGLGYDALENLGSAEKTLYIFENSGHSPMDSQSEEYVQIVISFIDRYK